MLLRDLVALETGGGNEFFGEPQWDIADFLRTAPDGRGVVSCLELAAVQDKPKLFSTVLMWLVAELFETLPEEGDLEQPKLVFFFDEAHLLFNDASKAFLESVSQTVRLIRSKGVGVFFVTQTPKDVPATSSASSATASQHALRAFTPDDQKALSATVKTFPKSDFYDLEELLTQMGIGEAAVTILDEKGVPTPVVHARLPGPRSRMDPADDIAGAAAASPLSAKYGTRVDAQSARELIAARMEASAAAKAAAEQAAADAKAAEQAAQERSEAEAAPPRAPQDMSPGGIGDFLGSRQGKQLQKEIVRGVFGMLKKKF